MEPRHDGLERTPVRTPALQSKESVWSRREFPQSFLDSGGQIA